MVRTTYGADKSVKLAHNATCDDRGFRRALNRRNTGVRVFGWFDQVSMANDFNVDDYLSRFHWCVLPTKDVLEFCCICYYMGSHWTMVYGRN